MGRIEEDDQCRQKIRPVQAFLAATGEKIISYDEDYAPMRKRRSDIDEIVFVFFKIQAGCLLK